MAEVSDQLLPENYYDVLGLYFDSSTQDIRRAYRKLAMQWHPDKWAKSPEFSGVAKRKFQQIQEAYSVLSDPKKRKLYDAGLYNPDDEEDEGFVDFLQEMASLMEKTRREDRHYSMEELQSMFWDMAKSFEFDEVSISPQQQASWFDYQQHPKQQTCWFDYQQHPQQQTCWFDHQQHPQQQVLEYESSQWFYTQYSLDDTKRTTKRVRRDTDYVSEKLYSHTVVEP